MFQSFKSSQRPDSGHPYRTPLEKKVETAINSFQEFIDLQVTAGILLLIATVTALLFANINELKPIYNTIANIKIGLIINKIQLTKSLYFWVNNALLTLFFFFVGLEIKRELLVGHLRDHRIAIMTGLCSLGGVAIPVLIYFLFNYHTEAQHGWGIPSTTDTAFVLGLISCFRHRLPAGAISFIGAIAILDDIMAIIIIATFYTQSIHFNMLYISAGIFSLMILLNYCGFRAILPYLILGFLLWLTVEAAGIHGTIAGILAAFCVPARPKKGPSQFIRTARQLLKNFKKHRTGAPILKNKTQHNALQGIHGLVKITTTPLQRWEDALKPFVLLLVLPLFAFINTGISISYHLILSLGENHVALGIIVGQVIGKPIGVLLFGYIAYRTNIGSLPKEMGLNELVAIAFLTGIGFTMSLFMSELSFNDPHILLHAKAGILFGSILSTLIGVAYIYLLCPVKKNYS
jgi:NhaA family Na+:H+ antiporter